MSWSDAFGALQCREPRRAHLRCDLGAAQVRLALLTLRCVAGPPHAPEVGGGFTMAIAASIPWGSVVLALWYLLKVQGSIAVVQILIVQRLMGSMLLMIMLFTSSMQKLIAFPNSVARIKRYMGQERARCEFRWLSGDMASPALAEEVVRCARLWFSQKLACGVLHQAQSQDAGRCLASPRSAYLFWSCLRRSSYFPFLLIRIPGSLIPRIRTTGRRSAARVGTGTELPGTSARTAVWPPDSVCAAARTVSALARSAPHATRRGSRVPLRVLSSARAIASSARSTSR